MHVMFTKQYVTLPRDKNPSAVKSNKHYNVNITMFGLYTCTKLYGNIRLPKVSHYNKLLYCDYLLYKDNPLHKGMTRTFKHPLRAFVSIWLNL